jgi:hypothetical protein
MFVHKWEVCAMLPMTKTTCLNHVTSMFDKTRSNDSNIATKQGNPKIGGHWSP